VDKENRPADIPADPAGDVVEKEKDSPAQAAQADVIKE
jgi:hypothetical protein